MCTAIKFYSYNLKFYSVLLILSSCILFFYPGTHVASNSLRYLNNLSRYANKAQRVAVVTERNTMVFACLVLSDFNSIRTSVVAFAPCLCTLIHSRHWKIPSVLRILVFNLCACCPRVRVLQILMFPSYHLYNCIPLILFSLRKLCWLKVCHQSPLVYYFCRSFLS